jgi:hypothetical protein
VIFRNKKCPANFGGSFVLNFSASYWLNVMLPEVVSIFPFGPVPAGNITSQIPPGKISGT